METGNCSGNCPAGTACPVGTASATPLLPGKRANIIGIRPIVDAVANVTIKTRNTLAESVTTSLSSTTNTTGISPVRQSGRYIRANVKIPAASLWTHAQGIDLTASPGGDR